MSLVKMESWKDFRNQFETKISWARVVTFKLNKSKNKKQKVACPLQMTSNHYNLLCNDTNDDDDDDDNDSTPTNLSKLRESITSRIKRDRKKNHKKSSVENKVHKVLILGDSHARGCASKVRNQLTMNMRYLDL